MKGRGRRRYRGEGACSAGIRRALAASQARSSRREREPPYPPLLTHARKLLTPNTYTPLRTQRALKSASCSTRIDNTHLISDATRRWLSAYRSEGKELVYRKRDSREDGKQISVPIRARSDRFGSSGPPVSKPALPHFILIWQHWDSGGRRF
jgi:hypothetical protein